MAKWIIGIIIIVLIGVAVWWSGWLKPGASAPAQSSQTASTTDQTAAQPENGMSATSDNSDAALSQDSAAIDSQMQGLNSDSASVNSSLNDQPVQQSY